MNHLYSKINFERDSAKSFRYAIFRGVTRMRVYVVQDRVSYLAAKAVGGVYVVQDRLNYLSAMAVEGQPRC